MNKRGFYKIGAISAFSIIVFLLVFFVLMPLLSSAELKEEYVLGERVKISLPEEQTKVKIAAPYGSFVQEASRSMIFVPREIGDYSVFIGDETSQFRVVLEKSVEGGDLRDPGDAEFAELAISREIYDKQISKDEQEVKMHIQKTGRTKINVSERVKRAESIRVYWKEKEEYLEFEADDKDYDGFIDGVEIEVDEQGEQTFLIIVITKAEHLDENKSFIEDVYELVKSQDSVFSLIPSNHYLRVNFERNLTNENDITIYARSNSSARIEVYEKDSSVKIAEFENISEFKEYKIFLTTLNQSQDTFDLKVVGGSIEFDYIVDPSIIVGTVASQDIAISSFDNKTFVVAWIDSSPNLYYQVYDTNGTSLTDRTSVTNNLDGDSAVSVAAINSTHFVVGWIDGDSGSEDGLLRGYTLTGGNWFNQFQFEGGILGPAFDISIIPLSDRYQVCYIDDAESDADIRTYLYSDPTTLSGGAETNLDTGANPDSALHNLIACAALNSTRFVASWFDDSGDTAAFSIRDQDRASVVGQTNVEAAGTIGQVDVASLNNNSFAIGYYDSVNQRIKTRIYDLNGNAITAITNADTAAGASSRVAMATVRNRTSGSDGYVLAWRDADAGAINATVYDSTGAEKYSYTLATDEHATSLLFDVYGGDSLAGTNLCPDTYIFAYTDTSDQVVVKTMNVNGSVSTGYCDFDNPSLTIISPSNTTYNTSSILFNASISDTSPITSVFYTINNGASNNTMTTSNNLTWNATNSSVPDGSYTARFYAIDINGNINGTQTIVFSVDTIASTIAINSPQPNNVNYSTSSVLFNLTLNSTGNSCWYNLDLGNNISMSSVDNIIWNATNTSVTEGTHTAYFYCNDSVNNIGTNNTVFRIDITPPSVMIFLPQPINYSTNNLNINFTSTDSGVGVQACWYSLNGGASNVSLASCQNTSFTASQGTSTLILYSNDTLGNTNTTENVTYFVDSVFSVLNFVPPTALNATSRSDTFIFVNISATEDNFVNITYRLFNDTGEVNITTYTSFIKQINWTGLDNNFINYTYNATIADIVGNTNSSETRYLQLTLGDISPPDIFFNSPDNEGDYYNISSVYFGVTLSEQGSLVWYEIDGEGNYTMSSLDNLAWNATNSSVPDGHYLIRVYANDSIGNLGSRDRNFSVDTTFPLIDYSFGTDADSANVSRNWVYVNVSVNEENEDFINFTLYNSDGLVNTSSYTGSIRTINWTGLSDGNYQFNVTIVDLASNTNFTSTKNIRIDTNNPGVVLLTPQNNSWVNNATQNLTANLSDNLALFNATLFVYNSTSLINQTELNLSGTQQQAGIFFLFPYNGNFSWQYIIRDSAGNSNTTNNNTLKVDTTFPLISFINSTEANNTPVERDWIYVNLSIAEDNFANITYTLFNTTDLVNQTTYTSPVTDINWSNLNSANITYYYNVSILDLALNQNYTETRIIKLIDTTPPSLNLINPQNKTYYYNESLPLEYDAFDVHLDSCGYNTDGGANVSLVSCADTTFNVTEGSHTLYLFANDSLGLLSRANVSFIANESLLQRRAGILAYGEGVDQIPKYRLWNGTNFVAELDASSVGGTIEWLRVKQSPSRDEAIIISADDGDNVNVQINGTNPIAGVSCWHNGTTCNSVLGLTDASTAVNRLKADAAYETTGEEAIVVWSQGNSTPLYKVWNGTYWSESLAIPQTLMTSGDISYLKLASHPFREEIALIMTNTTSSNILIWNGTSWGCQPTGLISGVLTADEYQHADLAYEQSSGDLFVVSSVTAGSTEFDYTTKEDGSCTYTTSRTTTMQEDAETLVLSSRYGSDHILIGIHTPTGNDMDSAVWTGIGFGTVNTGDNGVYGEVVPNLLISAAWTGTSDFGIITYSDAADSLNIDYFRYNISTNAWEGGTAGLDVAGLTAFSDEEQNIKSYSYIEENKSLIIVQDDADDLWAKAYNGETNSWSEPDNGVFLSDNVASTSWPAFDFEFDYDRAGPSITKISPISYVNSSSVFLNISLGEEGAACSYSVDGANSVSMSKDSTKLFTSTKSGISGGAHNLSFTCEDVWGNSRTTTNFSFTVDTTFPLISFINATEANNTPIERNWIYVNVSVTESNFANITYTLYNATDLVNQTTYTSLVTEINWSNLAEGVYRYNVTIIDLALNQNLTETRWINLTRIAPIVNLLYPSNNYNFTSYTISQFNFSFIDEISLANCSLYGNWSTGWHLNQTINNPANNTQLNFSSVTTNGDGFYAWNVLCVDSLGSNAFNSSNFTFSSFLPPDMLDSTAFNITQTTNDGTGDITLYWNSSNHSTFYRIYYSDNNLINFIFLNETNNPNYTDADFSGIRRFYRVDAWNPGSHNNSTSYFGTHVYTLKHSTNTKNWIAFPTNFSSLTDANKSLDEITNATSFTMWNSTIQQRVTCNNFSCPIYPSCTLTCCNFNLESGQAYEININGSAPSSVDWSGVGVVYNPIEINLVKNSTSFGKNWISMYANTTLTNAQSLLTNISNSDAASIWNESLQTSQGYIYIPGWGIYVGTNFPIELERGYEVSVNQTTNWQQV